MRRATHQTHWHLPPPDCMRDDLEIFPSPNFPLLYPIKPLGPHATCTQSPLLQRDCSPKFLLLNNSASGDACLLLFNDHVVSITPDLTVCLCVTVPRAAPTGPRLLSGFPFTPARTALASYRLQVTSQFSLLAQQQQL